MKRSLPAWLPFVVGAVLVVQFAGLGVWQINRGLEKRADRIAFRDQSTFSQFQNGSAVRPYQSIKVDGAFMPEQQFLLDNIILNSRYGYYVLTPLQTGEGEPLLIVNRGWIEKPKPGVEPGFLGNLGSTPVTVRGRVGSLPQPGIRMGEAILDTDSWPQISVWPTTDDLAASLGRDVRAFVLLMDPEDADGYLRHWVPEEMGPAKHFGYALQWFAMGAALAGILIWNFRKRREPRD